jgi:hypothetical protein
MTIPLPSTEIVARAGLGRSGGVEVLDVCCGRGSEGLHLALGYRDPGGSLDGRAGIVEGASGRLDRGQSAQAVGVQLGRKVQRGVTRMQVGGSRVTVGEAFDAHGTHDRGEVATMTGLDIGVHGSLGIDGPLALLAKGA